MFFILSYIDVSGITFIRYSQSKKIGQQNNSKHYLGARNEKV